EPRMGIAQQHQREPDGAHQRIDALPSSLTNQQSHAYTPVRRHHGDRVGSEEHRDSEQHQPHIRILARAPRSVSIGRSAARRTWAHRSSFMADKHGILRILTVTAAATVALNAAVAADASPSAFHLHSATVAPNSTLANAQVYSGFGCSGGN